MRDAPELKQKQRYKLSLLKPLSSYYLIYGPMSSKIDISKLAKVVTEMQLNQVNHLKNARAPSNQ